MTRGSRGVPGSVTSSVRMTVLCAALFALNAWAFAQATERVSVADNEAESNSYSSCPAVAVKQSGTTWYQFVAFASSANNLVLC